jgi:hypothetical protein
MSQSQQRILNTLADVGAILHDYLPKVLGAIVVEYWMRGPVHVVLGEYDNEDPGQMYLPRVHVTGCHISSRGISDATGEMGTGLDIVGSLPLTCSAWVG